ncbi:hypothetical protein QTP88_018018 [Uroleucon formosanum]
MQTRWQRLYFLSSRFNQANRRLVIGCQTATTTPSGADDRLRPEPNFCLGKLGSCLGALAFLRPSRNNTQKKSPAHETCHYGFDNHLLKMANFFMFED